MCEWLSYGEWCDVKLLCGGQAFNAHRAVLASVSTFLREILLSCQTDETPTFIVLPDFDLEAMSSVLYYIYNGEVAVKKQKMDRFLDIIRAMKIFIDYQFIPQSSCETIQDTNLESNLLNYATNDPRPVIFTLGLGDCGDRKCFNIKKGAMINDRIQYSLNKTDHHDKQVPSQNRSERCKTSLGNLKSPYRDRQRNSFLRDLFIETYPRNGNVNGQMAGVLAISNEDYRAPASVLLTNANGEHLSAGDTVLETYKNPSGVPFNLPLFSHPMKMQYVHNYNQDYHEKYSKSFSEHADLNVCSNEVIKMKSFYEKINTKSVTCTYGWENKVSAHKRVSLLPVALKEQTVSEAHGPYMDLSMRDPMTKDFMSSFSIQNNLESNNSLCISVPASTEKQKYTSATNNSPKVVIYNHVLNSPWTSLVPSNFKPFRRKMQDLENKGHQIHKVNKEAVVSDSNNNIQKSTPEQVTTMDVGSQSTSLYPALLIKSSYKCTICNQVFTNNESLSVHMRRHSTTSRYSCSECGKTFSQLRNFKYHMSIHRGTREFAATCTVCGKYFNDRGYLSSHMKIHRNRKEYKCSICPKSFNQRVAYNMHMRIHTGVKPHVCEECGKAFSRKMLLKQHQRTHSGERPYACPHCDKRFADRSNMTLHLRLHTGVKPFSCSLCPKSFTKKHHLKSHLNFHTGSKPYSCPRCKLAFTQSSNMRTHMKKCNVPETTDIVSASN